MATAEQVRRSIQRFQDHAGDLMHSDMNTFENALSLFIEFCETDSVFSAISAQLQSVPNTDFDQWYASQSFVLNFPTDPEVRMSLMYELLRRIRDGRIPFQNTIQFFHLGTSKITAYIQALNDAITHPLVRDLGYRLEEVVDQLPSDKAATVPQASIQIIHHATNVIQQSAIGQTSTRVRLKTFPRSWAISLENWNGQCGILVTIRKSNTPSIWRSLSQHAYWPHPKSQNSIPSRHCFRRCRQWILYFPSPHRS